MQLFRGLQQQKPACLTAKTVFGEKIVQSMKLEIMKNHIYNTGKTRK